MSPPAASPTRANDLVIWHAAKWRVVLVTTGAPGKPERLRLMRVVEVDADDVTPTGEHVDSGQRVRPWESG